EHLRGADEALDLDRDLAALPLGGEHTLGAEVDEHILGADANGEGVVGDGPTVAAKGLDNVRVVGVAGWHGQSIDAGGPAREPEAEVQPADRCSPGPATSSEHVEVWRRMACEGLGLEESRAPT